MRRLERALRLREPSVARTPRWLGSAMLTLAFLLVALFVLTTALGSRPDLSEAGGLAWAAAFLLLLGADKLPDPLGAAAGRARLAGTALLALGTLVLLAACVLWLSAG